MKIEKMASKKVKYPKKIEQIGIILEEKVPHFIVKLIVILAA